MSSSLVPEFFRRHTRARIEARRNDENRVGGAGYEIGVAAGRDLGSGRPTLSTEKASSVEAQIEKMPLVDYEQNLLALPETNHWEKKLKLAILAAHHAESIPGGELLGDAYLDELKRNPKPSMDAIANLVPKLDVANFALDRAALLTVAESLPGEGARAKALAITEMNSIVADPLANPDNAKTQAERDAIMNSDPKGVIPLVAYGVMLRTCPNADEALTETNRVLASQQDANLRNNIAAQFAVVYPAKTAEMIATLKQLGTAVSFTRVTQ